MGFFPAYGVTAAAANNAYANVVAAVTGCVINWYPKKCRVTVDTDALNGLMAETLCAIDKAGIAYDCNKPCQLAEAVPLLVVRCFSSYAPALTAPPATERVPILVDDIAADVTANGGVPPIWVWNCTAGAYEQINPVTGSTPYVKCFSAFTPALSAPPATNVASILIDDTLTTPVVWVWNCKFGVYDKIGGGITPIGHVLFNVEGSLAVNIDSSSGVIAGVSTSGSSTSVRVAVPVGTVLKGWSCQSFSINDGTGGNADVSPFMIGNSPFNSPQTAGIVPLTPQATATNGYFVFATGGNGATTPISIILY